MEPSAFSETNHFKSNKLFFNEYYKGKVNYKIRQNLKFESTLTSEEL
jgi:hypothetical protein